MPENATVRQHIIDSDSHITEPADVWVSRVPRKYIEQVPHVELYSETGHHHWRLGEHWLWPVGYLAQAGWNEFPPSLPYEYEDLEPATYDSTARLRRLDDFGIDAQLLYPNLIGFYANLLIELGPKLSVMCVRAYNDFALEWASADSRRLVPIAMLPFWDLDAAVQEMERCVRLGFKGVLFANKFERIGLPSFVSPHWDQIYAAAQDLDVPVNYHIGFAGDERKKSAAVLEAQRYDDYSPIEQALYAANVFCTQNELLGQILTSGLCERFPRLKLVSVESAFGHLPFYVESLDWHFRSFGNAPKMPLLPSEYFRRQCYGTLWFERTTLPLLELYPDNFMFSTDYPHITSISPGPCAGTEEMPSAYVADAYAAIDPDVRAKVLHQNAASLYKLDVNPTPRVSQ